MTPRRGLHGHTPLSREPLPAWRRPAVPTAVPHAAPPAGGETPGGAFCRSHRVVPSCLGSCGLSLLDVVNLGIVVSVLEQRPRAAGVGHGAHSQRVPGEALHPGTSGVLPRAAFALPLRTRATVLPYAGSGCLTSPVCRWDATRTQKEQIKDKPGNLTKMSFQGKSPEDIGIQLLQVVTARKGVLPMVC